MKQTSKQNKSTMQIKSRLVAGSYKNPKPCNKCDAPFGSLICEVTGRCPEDNWSIYES